MPRHQLQCRTRVGGHCNCRPTYQAQVWSSRVRITITIDFVGAVREKVSDPDYAAAYEQRGEFAVAIAKTITQDDGTIDLIVTRAC